MRLLMIHKACMPVYMNSGKIVAGRDGTGGRVDIEGSTRGPRGPKKGLIGQRLPGTVLLQTKLLPKNSCRFASCT